jgi:alanine racemase
MHRRVSTGKLVRATRAEIDLDAIHHNFRQVRSRVGSGVRIMSVVKANAYGHGIVEVSSALLDAGTDYLGVGIFEEGVLLREHGVEAPILVLGPPFEAQLKAFVEYQLDVTLCTGEAAGALDTLGSSLGRRTAVHVKIDTGMGRIGVSHNDAVEFVKYVSSLTNLELRGIYTQLATADEKDKRYARTQLTRFHDVVSTLGNIGISIPLKHCANSAAILDLRDSYYDMVRPGVTLYGYFPSRETSESLSLRPALSWRSKIGFVKRVDAGTPISYGRKFVTNTPTTIASLPVGYADGLSRSLTNKVEVLINGRRFRTVGAVCMDQVMVDLGTSANAKTGDDVTIIGTDGNEQITAWDVAEKQGTIPYEVTCGISDRVPRVYS